jgi:hypothetical protein
MDKPTILIVPGGFTLPELYEKVVNHVSSKGYPIHALHLPSVGYKTNRPGTMQDDAAFVSTEISKYADEGKDVVLVAHSYGGIPATESTKGLSKAERQRQGKSGGLVRLAYISCIILPVGESDASVIMPDNMLPRVSPFEIRFDVCLSHAVKTTELSLSTGRWMVAPNRYIICCLACIQRSTERRGRNMGENEHPSIRLLLPCYFEPRWIQRCPCFISAVYQGSRA